MRRYYVTLVDGVVQHKPKEIGLSQIESPNVYWSPEQMKLNGFVEVTLEYDPIQERLDLDTPIVSNGEVKYAKTPRGNEEVLTFCRKTRIDQLTRQADNIILTKYPLMKLIYAALGVDSDDIKEGIKTITDSLRQAKTNIDQLTKRADIEAYTHEFPSI